MYDKQQETTVFISVLQKGVFNLTRSYFLDYVTDWDELIEMCRDEECNICDDIIDDDQLDEYVESDIEGTNYSWRDIRDFLQSIPTGYNYYRCDGAFDYVAIDDSYFEDYKNQVLEWMDDGGYWEHEDEDYDPDGYDDEEPEPEEPPVEEEDFSVSDLIGMCGVELVTIRQAAERQRITEEEALGDMSLLFAV